MTVYQNIGGSTAQVGVSRTTLGVTFNMGNDDGTIIDTQLYNANSVCTVQLLTINGFTAIDANSCPTFATSGGLFIVPPTGNLSTITLKGVTADTGIPLKVSAPTFLCLPTPPTAFGITTGGSVAFKLVWV
jgi:hypothetical protein